MISLKVIWNPGMTLEIRAPYFLCIHPFVRRVIRQLYSTQRNRISSLRPHAKSRDPCAKVANVSSYGVMRHYQQLLKLFKSWPLEIRVSPRTAKCIMQNCSGVRCFCILPLCFPGPRFGWMELRVTQTESKGWLKPEPRLSTEPPQLNERERWPACRDPTGGSSGPYICGGDGATMKESLEFSGYVGHSVQNETCDPRKISLYLVIKRAAQVVENELHRIAVKTTFSLHLSISPEQSYT